MNWEAGYATSRQPRSVSKTQLSGIFQIIRQQRPVDLDYAHESISAAQFPDRPGARCRSALDYDTVRMKYESAMQRR